MEVLVISISAVPSTHRIPTIFVQAMGTQITTCGIRSMRTTFGNSRSKKRYAVMARKWLVNGWQVSGTVFARTGLPYTATDFAETANLVNDNIYGTIYSVPVAPIELTGSCGKGAVAPAAPVPCLPPQVLKGSPNPAALFVQTGCKTGFNSGNLPGPNGPCSGPSVTIAQGRNRFRGPGDVSKDLAIMKNTTISNWQNGVFTIGFQFFNLFNHANFGLPDTLTSDATFGQIFFEKQPPTTVLGLGLNANVSGRMIQVKAQVRFCVSEL
jgi:hypothetical protein